MHATARPVVFAVCLTLLLVMAARFYDHTVDDAFISFRYAANLLLAVGVGAAWTEIGRYFGSLAKPGDSIARSEVTGHGEGWAGHEKYDVEYLLDRQPRCCARSTPPKKSYCVLHACTTSTDWRAPAPTPATSPSSSEATVLPEFEPYWTPLVC